MKTSWGYCGALLCTTLMLGACESPAPKASGGSAPPAAAPVAPEVSASQQRETQIDHLLLAGDRALAADRLLSPLEDNAYDRFQAVLLLDPDNSVARSGLQAIVLRYLDLARSAAARSEFTQALIHTGLAADIDPGNPVVEELMAGIRAQQAQHQAQRPVVESDDEHLLDPVLLRRQAEEIIEQLGNIAREVRLSGETILIVARTDAEGRWIYQQMRDAVPGYLLRGDITLGTRPRIQRLPPL